ncbi:MAG: hypothetical protein ISS81_02350 [Candidatus Marinimicrobia bacterium]|nr:hypothetical protein [Candidatus Neomarinimicrobiota bacterium]
MKKCLMVLIGFLVIIGCEKELSIAEFEDDFKNYTVELRIEAVLDPRDFMNSVVRVDRTMLVTDTSLFNGIDDNGDWVSYTDENGNGQWDEGEPLNDDIGIRGQGPPGTFEGRGNGKPDPGEPHVDDYIEILPQIHDSTMTSVVLVHKSTNILIAEFEWVTQAGEFEESYGRDKPGPGGESMSIITYTYGGYKPITQYSDVNIEYSEEYEFRITTSTGDEITGSTAPLAPTVFDEEGFNWNSDTLISSSENPGILKCTTDPECFVIHSKVERILGADSSQIEVSNLFATNEIDESGQLVYSLPLFFLGAGLYQITVSVLDEHYGNYFISSLPLHDEAMSNLRDQHGSVVLGIAGSATANSIYVRINDYESLSIDINNKR